MPYVFDTRRSGSFVSSYTNDSGARRVCDSPTFLEQTYGLRTGKRVSGKQTDERDVYNPPKGASLVEILAYRKKFIERQVTKMSLDPNSTAPTHFILSDMGNEFANYKFRSKATENRITIVNSTGGHYFVNALPELTMGFNSAGTFGPISAASDLFSFMYTRRSVTQFSSGYTATGMPLASAMAEGTNAIKRLNPIQSHASVLTTLLELVRGDVPGVLKQLRKHLTTITDARRLTKSGMLGAGSAVGGTYLENVFGWTPIFRDINNAINVLTTIDSLLFPPDSTRRTEQRVLHRWQGAGGFISNPADGVAVGPLLAFGDTPEEQNNHYESSGVVFNGYGSGLTVNHTATETLDVRTTVRFQTGLVPNARNNGFSDRLQDLLGLRLTPEVIWDLTPWSWLIDWFTNIGTVVENLGNIHMSNLILNYAYATFQQTAEIRSLANRPTVVSSGTGFRAWEGSMFREHLVTQKVRLKASPYGFATALGSLNASQWAILVALGLARAR